jgi:hypothetical protein
MLNKFVLRQACLEDEQKNKFWQTRNFLFIGSSSKIWTRVAVQNFLSNFSFLPTNISEPLSLQVYQSTYPSHPTIVQ